MKQNKQNVQVDLGVQVSSSSGNTLKYEEFERLPDGIISSGVITDGPEGINIDNSGELLYYVIQKDSNQDWAVFCLREVSLKGMPIEEKQRFVRDTGTKLTIGQNIKRVFNCSKKVMEHYTF